MNTYEIIKTLANDRKMTVAELERKLDLSNGSVSKWAKSTPNSKYLEKVADYFLVKKKKPYTRRCSKKGEDSPLFFLVFFVPCVGLILNYLYYIAIQTYRKLRQYEHHAPLHSRSRCHVADERRRTRCHATRHHT